MTYDTGTNRLSTVGGAAVSYDAAGNLTTDDTGRTYQWDAEGRMKSIDGPGSGACSPSGSTICYTYNALGQRVEEQSSGYSGAYPRDLFGRPIGAFNAGAGWWWRYQLDVLGRPVYFYYSAARSRYHVNHLGSGMMATNEAGTPTGERLFYPWGQEWATASSAAFTHFASLEPPMQSTTNELYPTLFRMYHARLYRWLSPDPLAGSISNPQSLNRYAYVLNNPCNLRDPLGLEVVECITTCIITSEGGGFGSGGSTEERSCTTTCKYSPDPLPGAGDSGSTGGRGPTGGSGPRGGGGGSGGGAGEKPKTPNPCTGGGFAFVAGGTAALGVIGTGAAATTAGGAGGFFDSQTGPSVGAFSSGGATAYFGTHTAGVPAQGNTTDDRSALGAFGGVGVGVLITNAGSARALKRTTSAFSFDIGFHFGGSIQISAGGGIWALSITLGPAYGVSFAQLNTATAAAGGECE